MRLTPPPLDRARRAAARIERELERQADKSAVRRRFYDAQAICDLYMSVRVTKRGGREPS